MELAIEPVAEIREKRRYRTVGERRRIVEETLADGVSVAIVARPNGVNANQVFYWRKLYRSGLLERKRVFQAVLLSGSRFVTLSCGAV